MRLRSVVAVGPDGAGLEDALTSAADAVCLTVADGSRPVGALRTAALEALPRIREAGKHAVMMVNHPRTRLLRDDLDALVTADLAAVLLAHTVIPQDVRDLAVLLREFEFGRGIEPGEIKAFPVIDSARGLIRAHEIAEATPRVGGLVFAPEAYARDVGARHEEKGPRLAYARGSVVAAARATDRLPLVVASALELLDMSQYGFAGAIIPDVRAAMTANVAFGSSAAARERAELLIAAFDGARAEGAWVARVGDEVVDSHAARKAHQVLES